MTPGSWANKGFVLVLLADEALHDTTNLVGIGGNVGLDILRVEGAV